MQPQIMTSLRTMLIALTGVVAMSGGATAQVKTCLPNPDRYACEHRNWVYARLIEIASSRPDYVRVLLRRARCKLDSTDPLVDQVKSCETEKGARFACAMTITLVDDAKQTDPNSFYANCARH